MKLRVLGCGGSAGVPSIAGDWGTCNPSNPKNKRTRTSLAIHPHPHTNETWLIDAGPDIRSQLLRENISHVSGLFLTHAHADHILGLDEFRIFYFKNKKKIPLYASLETLQALESVFPHLFHMPSKGLGHGTPDKRPFDAHVLASQFSWKNIQVHTFPQAHGAITSWGYRFGNWAYTTDVKALSEEALQILEGTQLWFVEALGTDSKNPSHASLNEALAWIKRIKPQRAILIHMGYTLDYNALKEVLPPFVEPAYDGMVIEIEGL
jgi:phosphoribosyl 1,2-cyclic phosphate phosphodiesterase